MKNEIVYPIGALFNKVSCHKARGILFVILLGMTLSACDIFLNEEAAVKQARQSQSDNNHRAAVIQFKKIIKKNPDNKQARMFLSESYLMTEQPESAEKEIMRSRQLGASDADTILVLARALLMQRAYDRIFSEVPLSKAQTAEQKTALSMVHGYAHLGIGATEQARQIFTAISQKDNSSPQAWLALADVEMISGNVDESLKLVDKAINIDEGISSAWLQKGRIHLSQKNHNEARKAFGRVVALSKPDLLTKNLFSARVSLIQLSLIGNDFQGARKNSDLLVKLASRHPISLYFSGLIDYQQKNYDKARTALENVVTKAPAYMPAQLLLGSIYFAQENFELANDYLTVYVNHVPTHIQARKMLGAVQMKLGRHEEALKLLKEGESGAAGNDAGLLAMIGRAAIMSNQSGQAEDYLRRASKALPQNNLIKEELAKLYLRKGSVDQAIEELGPSSSNKSQNSRQMLVYAHLRKNNVVEARKVAKGLLESAPLDPGSLIVAGTVELFAAQRGTARSYFTRALGVQKEYIPALLSLARMDYEDNQIEQASQKYMQILARDEKNIKAMFGLAQIAERRADSKQAVGWIEEAYNKNPNILEPVLILGKHYLQTGQINKALALAMQAAEKHTNNQLVLSMLTQAYLRSGQKNEALKVATKIVNKWPKSPASYFDLARVQDSLSRFKEVEKSLTTAVKLKPDFLLAKASLVTSKLKLKDYQGALKLTQQIQLAHPKLPVGLVLMGDVYMSQKNYRRAQQAYTKATKIKHSSGLSRKLYLAFKRDNKQSQGMRVLEDWFKEHPEDAAVEFELANAYNELGNLSKAKGGYESLLTKNPDNVSVLNNLAYLLMDSKPAKARSYAERAYQLQPEHPGVADTYGWILVHQGSLDEALPILQSAANKSQHPTIQYHLAVILEKTGAKQQAKSVLDQLIKSGVPFDELDAAKKLQKSL